MNICTAIIRLIRYDKQHGTHYTRIYLDNQINGIRLHWLKIRVHSKLAASRILKLYQHIKHAFGITDNWVL